MVVVLLKMFKIIQIYFSGAFGNSFSFGIKMTGFKNVTILDIWRALIRGIIIPMRNLRPFNISI